MQLFSADTAIFFLKKFKFFFAHKKFKKPPSKDAQKTSNPLFFPYCPELSKRSKQKNLCSKMWLVGKLYIELGLMLKQELDIGDNPIYPFDGSDEQE